MLVSNQTLKEGFNMCQQNNNTKSKKGKHLNYEERQSICICVNDVKQIHIKNVVY